MKLQGVTPDVGTRQVINGTSLVTGDFQRVAFLDEQAGQCGYCLSGILIAATALLKKKPKPSRADIVEALDPHLCRCGIHNRVVRAIQKASA